LSAENDHELPNQRLCDQHAVERVAMFHGHALSADRECRYRADYRKEMRE
jgi:hypothetical protein